MPQRLLAGVLLFVAVDGGGLKPALANDLTELFAALLGAGEHEHLLYPLRVQVPQLPYDFLLLLLPPVSEHDLLGDVGVGGQLAGADLDVDDVFLKVPRQLLHALWPRRRPQQRLAIRAYLADNLPYVGLKPHIQHAVRLVHDQIRNAAQVRHTALDKVNQPSGRRHKTVNSVLQLLFLLPFGRAAIDDRRTHLVGKDLCELGMDLLSELSRRC
mmetsp:Transcript_95362/g.269614  ORF Transcript_95362/g.269614 Transcript_95362/m.269614 type:complete len:214 (+) Transcript_95362:713-1354(+)